MQLNLLHIYLAWEAPIGFYKQQGWLGALHTFAPCLLSYDPVLAYSYEPEQV